MTGILGKKIGMTRLILEDGRVVPVTIVECKPNTVMQLKTTEKDGYSAAVIGFEEFAKPSKNRKYKHIKEFRLSSEGDVKKGDQLTVEIFEEGEAVCVSGTSKGKGFQGVIRRHNFARGPQSHGSHHNREPGSVGACAKPGNIHRGKKLPGRMGQQRVTLNKASIVYVDKVKNLIGIKGALPGGNKSLVTIKKIAQ